LGLMLPIKPYSETGDVHDPLQRQVRSDPHDMLSSVRYRFRDLDSRLPRLEKYVTSNRFQLDSQFRRLKSSVAGARGGRRSTNPFEFVITIILIPFVYKLVSMWIRSREHRRTAADESVNSDLLQRLGQLEERVRVLERIVTDERFELKQQFKDLAS